MDYFYSVLKDFVFGFLIGTAVACTIICAGAVIFLLFF